MKHFFIFLVWGILAVNLWAQTDLWGPEGAWPMFQADSRHSGRSSFAGPQTPNLLWSKKNCGSNLSANLAGGQLWTNLYFR